MKQRVIFCCLLLVCWPFIGDAGDSAAPLPEELVLARAQPAVFMIHALGDINVSYPKDVTVKGSLSRPPSQATAKLDESRSVLEAEYARDLRDGLIAKNKIRSEYFWEKIAENPGKYLAASQEHESRSFENVQYAHGTGFAVSREGILLTNAHVVVGDEDSKLLSNVGFVLKFLGQPIDDMIATLSKQFGGKPTEVVIIELAQWFARQSSAKIIFKQAYVVLDFGTPESFKNWQKQHGTGQSLLQTLTEYERTRRPLIVSAEVLATGETLPGRDVAVLKIKPELVFYNMNPSSRVKSAANVDARDRLICLPLGDSDAITAGARIQGMGFPGGAFNPSALAPEAQFRVSSKPGHISTTKPMQGGWEALEMTSSTESGMSGGPVLDQQGNVIGLNVGSVTGQTQLNLAVPINVAKEFLKQAGIQPDPGPLTRQWVEGLQLFGSGRYTEAYVKFLDVVNQQSMSLTLSDGTKTTVLSDQLMKYGNPYIHDMLKRAESKKSQSEKQ
jgi:S1-C subfamily serine protease